ncbi:MAG: MFS transporter [Ardenticatenaceae bacterium]|nr:MFS transporter [Ardenticatenaceae bacterium]MCB9445541.1 MFS transporter [Ardenticatenaceae bacterium]
MTQAETNTSQSLKPFFILWSGQSVSLLGSQLVQFALIWWLTQTTGSATVLAMASLAGFLPQVVLGPFVGVLVDRWNRRLTMFAADASVAAATVVLAYLFWIEAAQIWHVFAILFIRSLAGSFHWPAMMASTSLMVPKEHLTRIQGLNQALNGGLSIVSAPLGAFLLGVMPLQGVLAIDVVTAVFAITPLIFIHVPQPARQPNGEATNLASFWSDMREGFNYLRSWRGLLVMSGMAMLIKILLNPAFSLIPLLVTGHFGGGAMQLGVLEAITGVGIVVGGLALGAWGGFKKRIVTVNVGLIGLGAGLIVMGAAPAALFVMGLAGAFVVGAMISLIDGPIMAILQATIEPELQGRVMMLFGSLISSTVPLGLIIAGPVADLIGIRAWFMATGVLTAVIAVAGFFMPVLMGVENGRSLESTVGEQLRTEPVI